MSVHDRIEALIRLQERISELIDLELLGVQENAPEDIDVRTAQVEDDLITEFCAVLEIEICDEDGEGIPA